MSPILMESPPVDYSHLRTIKTSCDKLINDTQADLRNFQEEQNFFRQTVIEVVQEHKALNSKLDSQINQLSSIKENYDGTNENLGKQAIAILKKQVETLKKENDELKAFNKTSHKTIANLEEEIQMYRKQCRASSKPKYSPNYKEVIHTLDDAMKAQKIHSDKQLETIDNLVQKNAKLEAKLAILSKELQEITQQLVDAKCQGMLIEDLKSQLRESLWQCEELEKQLHACRQKMDVHRIRENNALEKVQEAVSVAEAAVAKQNEAVQRFELLKDEYDYMANTIGEVMDEASNEADKDKVAIKKRYNEKKKQHKQYIVTMHADIKQQGDTIRNLQTRSDHLEEVCRQFSFENKKVINELKGSIKSMEGIDAKLKMSDVMVAEYKKAKRRYEDDERQMQQYLNENKALIQKYKDIIEENTKQFTEQIFRMQHENTTLKTELKLIRLKFKLDDDFG